MNKRVIALQREVTDAEDRLKRLYRLVEEDGKTDLDDVLEDRLNNLKADRGRARAALEAAKSQHGAEIRIDPALIESFGRAMHEKLTTGSDAVPEGLSSGAHRRNRGRRRANSD